MSTLTRLNKILDIIACKRTERKTYKKEIKMLEKDIYKMQGLQEKIDKSNIVLQYIIENKQQNIIDMFESTVTSAIQEIFEENYTFKLEFSKRNKMSSIDFVINTGEYGGYIPLKMCQGKALAETIAYTLSVIFVAMLEGRKIMACDESFGGIELEREHRAGVFINKVCQDFGIQLIAVSHKAGIYDSADNVVRI